MLSNFLGMSNVITNTNEKLRISTYFRCGTYSIPL